MKLIDADELYKFHVSSYGGEDLSEFSKGWNCCIKHLTKYAPTIDASPVVNARWALIEGFWCCSTCGCSPADWKPKPNNPYGLPPYCHCCGAKMEVPKDEV